MVTSNTYHGRLAICNKQGLKNILHESQFTDLPLKNCSLPPGALVALIGAPLPLILPLPACFPADPFVPAPAPTPPPALAALSLLAAAPKLLCGCGPSAVGDEADDEDDAGDDCGETPTRPPVAAAAVEWCCRTADGDNSMVAVPLTVVVVVVLAAGSVSVIVAHFVRILLMIS